MLLNIYTGKGKTQKLQIISETGFVLFSCLKDVPEYSNLRKTNLNDKICALGHFNEATSARGGNLRGVLKK